MKLDGRGGLIFYEVHSGETRRIALGQLDCLSVLSMPPATAAQGPMANGGYQLIRQLVHGSNYPGVLPNRGAARAKELLRLCVFN